jgi:hypothetical protein
LEVQTINSDVLGRVESLSAPDGGVVDVGGGRIAGDDVQPKRIRGGGIDPSGGKKDRGAKKLLCPTETVREMHFLSPEEELIQAFAGEIRSLPGERGSIIEL